MTTLNITEVLVFITLLLTKCRTGLSRSDDITSTSFCKKNNRGLKLIVVTRWGRTVIIKLVF